MKMTHSHTNFDARLLAIVVIILTLGLLTGCTRGRNTKSGGDHVRGKAVEIKIGKTHDDRISADDGDHTDWKKFTLENPEILNINAYWDDPSVRVRIRVKDQFGGNVFDLRHKRGKKSDHWKNMKMREGEYYLQVSAKSGSSVYTLELKTSQGENEYQPDTSVRPPE